MWKKFIFDIKHYSRSVSTKLIHNEMYETDSFTNITPRIVSCLDRKLYCKKDHPISLLKEKIIQYFYSSFRGRTGNAIFSVYDNLKPIVTIQQNFDSLLVPDDHPSRARSDCYYINKEFMLRAHMTAHQSELLTMGLNNFLMVGDVYRRDKIDSTHYPVFHQLDGVRLFTAQELFRDYDDGISQLNILENNKGIRTKTKQEVYTEQASQMVEKELKETLQNLAKNLFGENIKYKWVDAEFPFTHPSWELEVMLNEKWTEVLGCGIMEHKILDKAGCGSRIGWAFGLGLERLAMVNYFIPDIRIFWSTDPGFLCQFRNKNPDDKIIYKPVSVYSPCSFDLSLWIGDDFESNDLYDAARDFCGDLIEQMDLVDSYKCKKTDRASRTYRIVYRSMEKTLSKIEVNKIHKELEKIVEEKFKAKVR